MLIYHSAALYKIERPHNLTQEELDLLQKLLAKINENKKDASNENQQDPSGSFNLI